MFPNDIAFFCVVIKVLIFATKCQWWWFFGGAGNMKCFLILLWVLHYIAQQEMFNWQVLSEVRVCHIFSRKASTAQLRNAFL